MSAELSLFKRLPFPYAKELKDLRNESRPNLYFENVNQSLYAAIKYIRNELVFKKLKDRQKLVLDRYISDIAGLPRLNVDHYYPPENIDKLDRFLTKLKQSGISQVHYVSIVYYILKDFSFDAAESYIKNGAAKELSQLGNQSLSCKISKNQYDLINSIYYFDRFNIVKALRFLQSGSVAIQSSQFIDHLIRLANIIPYHPETNIQNLSNLNEIRSFININSSSETSLSVTSVIYNFSNSILLLDLDILFIYLDSLTDVSPLNSILLSNELVANYQSQSLPISVELIFKIIIKKLFLKTYRQRDIIRTLFQRKYMDRDQFNQIFDTLAMFQLYNSDHSYKVDSILYDILLDVVSDEEKQLTNKYPNFFNKLNEHNDQTKLLIRDFLVLRKVSDFNAYAIDLLNLSKVGNSVKAPSKLAPADIVSLLRD